MLTIVLAAAAQVGLFIFAADAGIDPVKEFGAGAKYLMIHGINRTSLLEFMSITSILAAALCVAADTVHTIWRLPFAIKQEKLVFDTLMNRNGPLCTFSVSRISLATAFVLVFLIQIAGYSIHDADLRPRGSLDFLAFSKFTMQLVLVSYIPTFLLVGVFAHILNQRQI